MQTLRLAVMAALHTCAPTRARGLSVPTSLTASLLSVSPAAMRARGAALATSKDMHQVKRQTELLNSGRLTFTSTSIAGKKMIVQATNTGGDLSEGQFDLAIPGGGVVRTHQHFRM